MKSLPEFGKEDHRKELRIMSISKQLRCREKMRKALCEKKTIVNLEARLPSDRKEEDYQKEKKLEDNQN